MSNNPSGGLRWHWRAWRRHAGLWRETCAQIEDWLMAQHAMPSATLILVGASAGWMMPPRWLQRFTDVQTWDIDPWSAPLFRWRHGAHLRQHGIPLMCHRADGLSALPDLVRRHPEALFWFDNLLGQLCLFHPDQAELTSSRLHALRTTLAPVAWGSLHDRLSGPVEANGQPIPPLRTVAAGSDPEAAEQQAWLHSIQARNAWGDHLTGEVFPQGTPVAQIAWPFSQRHWHWLEMGWLPAAKPTSRP